MFSSILCNVYINIATLNVTWRGVKRKKLEVRFFTKTSIPEAQNFSQSLSFGFYSLSIYGGTQEASKDFIFIQQLDLFLSIPHINSETNPPSLRYQCYFQVSETVSWHNLRCCHSANILQH